MKEFPNKKLAAKKLSQIYHKYKIRKKKLRNTKVLTEVQLRRIRFYAPEVKEEL